MSATAALTDPAKGILVTHSVDQLLDYNQDPSRALEKPSPPWMPAQLLTDLNHGHSALAGNREQSQFPGGHKTLKGQKAIAVCKIMAGSEWVGMIWASFIANLLS